MLKGVWSRRAPKSPVSPSSSFSKEAQRKGAKEIHKYFMAKKSLNESRKSTIHKEYPVFVMVVSTQSQVVSTLVSTLVQGIVDTSLSSQKNSFAEMGQCVDTLPGGVDTLRLKLKNVNFSRHVAAWELGDLT
ncbi:hypothetical protein Taro_025986 [Colocasia esculenta]|uniref:Uncharacterized protein n=1 Tax=Colocasia esculenta TaxID=4460 RepID=A0A843VBP4_COLES|nr:hypothetical protein [Colocasia esculenta]